MAQEILKATHEGILNIGTNPLNCYVLEDGTRIISQTAIYKAFGRTQRGRKKDEIRVLNMPSFIDANNLQPFINEELRAKLKQIDYYDINGKKTSGYQAVIIPLLCDVYLNARQEKVLKSAQLALAQTSEILVRSLSKVGITALVDEATGYQYDREKDALQVILKAYITDELLKWQQKFPDTFYFEIFRLNKWDYTVSGIKKRPGVIGTWTNELIYKQLPKGVLDELKAKTPKSESGNYTARFFQSLTTDIGHPALTAQIYKVIGIMNISNTWEEFKSSFNRMVDRTNGQTELKFEEIEKKIQTDNSTEPLKLNLFDNKLKKALEYKPKDKAINDNQVNLNLEF